MITKRLIATLGEKFAYSNIASEDRSTAMEQAVEYAFEVSTKSS